MVKVLCCHHFASQDVFSTQGEPLCMCATDDYVFVATTSCSIDVHSLKEKGCPLVFQVPNISPAKQLFYSKQGKFLATLEFKMSRNVTFTFARVYVNWDLHCGSHGQMKVRLAGHHGNRRSRTNQSSPQLEVIEIPTPRQPMCLSVCPVSGHLAVGYDTVVSVHRVTEEFISSTAASSSGDIFHDVEHLFDISLTFAVIEVAIHENFIAAASQNVIQVIKLCSDLALLSEVAMTVSPLQAEPTDESKYILKHILQHRNKERDGSTSKLLLSMNDSEADATSSDLSSSPTLSTKSSDMSGILEHQVEDEYCTEWGFEEGEVEIVLPMQGGRMSKQSVPRNIVLDHLEKVRSSQLGEPSATELLGPVRADHPLATVQIKLHAEGVPDFHAVTLLCRRFGLTLFQLHSLQLLPTYTKEPASTYIPSGPFSCQSSEGLIGMSVFVSGKRVGYMYTVSPKVEALPEYPYTINAKKVTVGPHFLHAVTETGLETYTSRSSLAALHHTETFGGIHKASPPPSLEICLIGMQPFIGLGDVFCTPTHTILLSKDLSSSFSYSNRGEKGSSLQVKKRGGVPVNVKLTPVYELGQFKYPRTRMEWSLYALENSTVQDIYRDMVEMGMRNKQGNPPAYLQLIQEAHIVLKQNMLIGGADNKASNDLYLESCALLGEYYASPQSEHYELALPYYIMSDLAVGEIMSRLFPPQPKEKISENSVGKGLIHYLNYVLFENEEAVTVEQHITETILHVYSVACPEKLPVIVLDSNLTCYNDEHALSRLKWSYPLLHKEDQYLNQLAQAVVQLRLGEPAEAEACLMSIPSEGMIQACLRYHNILHVDLTSLSHVAQLSRQSTPKMFIDILVALHDEGVFTMDVAVKLLQGELSTTDLWTNTHIRDYLEMLLSNPSRQFIFKEGSILLAQIYLDRLRHWRPVQTRTLPTPGHSHIPKGRGHFGKRQAWLDEMTPFKGTQSIFHQPCTKLQLSAAQSKLRHRIASDPVQINRSRQVADLVTPEMKQRSSENLDVHTVVREKAGNVEGECSCCCCNEDLLKLQSLLCSKYATVEFVKKVMDSLNTSFEDFLGRVSVQLLCLTKLDVEAALDSVIENHPSLIPVFASSVCGNRKDQWNYVLDSLTSILRQSTESSSSHKLYTEAYKGVVRNLSELLDPKTFLNMLPSEGNLHFFLPYLQHCCEIHLANQLRDTIISKGETIKKEM